jgi:hypothetical protein
LSAKTAVLLIRTPGPAGLAEYSTSSGLSENLLQGIGPVFKDSRL